MTKLQGRIQEIVMGEAEFMASAAQSTSLYCHIGGLGAFSLEGLRAKPWLGGQGALPHP